MNIKKQFLLVFALVLMCGLYILPWKQFGVNTDFLNKPYTLGLDLQGGVELDYKIDFSGVDKTASDYNEATIVEGLKRIIDKRVNSLGLAEPTIQTMKYGQDTHLIVQIPTKDYKDLSDEARALQQKKDIQNAKETIGKLIKLEFKEFKPQTSEADKLARKNIANNLQKDLKKDGYDLTAQKYTGQYEGVSTGTGIGELPNNIDSKKFKDVKKFPYISSVFDLSYILDENNTIQPKNVFAIVELDARTGSGQYDYKYFFVDSQPSQWVIAKTTDGKALTDKYLNNAGTLTENTGETKVTLNFNDEGKKIFGEISSRLVGKQIAIYVGGEMLTAPTVQQAITNGMATIDGQRSPAEARKLANDINTGIIPAPIYLTSERTIDAKIGSNALNQIIVAGFIGFAIILVFLVFFYRVSGFIAGLALLIYVLFLIAIIKISGGIVLTLASIAGIILSIGMAIDANILIFERIRESLKDKKPLDSAIKVGFKQSWSAILDSQVTSFVSAFILYIVGVSLIKGFGLMLGIGIIVSLFTAMWVSRVMLLLVGKKMSKAPQLFIGYKK
ncbi:protein translocase subunit SecD [Candidatus Gracilibacteria bacterium]|nr:protein translocase subunit SecD [Candidatus Gracilibacteria bacterium]